MSDNKDDNNLGYFGAHIAFAKKQKREKKFPSNAGRCRQGFFKYQPRKKEAGE